MTHHVELDFPVRTPVPRAGYDPYDALMGTRVPMALRGSPRGRQAVVQLRKRVPVDVGRVLGIEAFDMSKARALFLLAAVRQAQALPAHAEVGERSHARDAVRTAAAALAHTQGNLGHGRWGYEFDVQTRWAFYPAGTPNLIVTFFAARAQLEAGLFLGAPDLLAAGLESARFVSEELLVAAERPYLRYTPTSDELVHNANLLGAGLCAVAGALERDPVLLEIARAAALTSCEAQEESGRWAYGVGDSLSWCDNFHTAYDLDGLHLVELATADSAIATSLARGLDFWLSRFFGRTGAPHYYDTDAYPYDIHSAATAVDVGARLAAWGFPSDRTARRVARWTTQNLVDPHTGRTYFRRHRTYTDRRSFVRWGDAHWAMGLASLAMADAGRRSILEEHTLSGRCAEHEQ